MGHTSSALFDADLLLGKPIREAFLAASYVRVHDLCCVHARKSNKVLLFWDLGILVSSDLSCLCKTLFVAVCSFM